MNLNMKVSKDNDLIESWNKFILDGNHEALSRVYFHYYDFFYDFGQRHTSDIQLVEDVIQDVFVNFIKVRKSLSIVKNLNAYLITVFRNQLFLDLKKQKKTILIKQLPDEHFEYFKNPNQDISDKENLEQLYFTIKQCIGTLTEKQQEIIYLRFEREISYEEISVMLDITVESCYKSIYRSIKTIRKEAEKVLRRGGDIFQSKKNSK